MAGVVLLQGHLAAGGGAGSSRCLELSAEEEAVSVYIQSLSGTISL